MEIGYIIPECYFDTVLVKICLGLTKRDRVNHQMGCNNVARVMKDGRLKDSFAVGIIDKDKVGLNYLGEFVKCEFENLNLYKHKTKSQYMIELTPPLERWILNVAAEAQLNIADYGLPTDFEELRKLTKSELADETRELESLCSALVNSSSATIKRLCSWLTYLKDNRYQADIKDLINDRTKEII